MGLHTGKEVSLVQFFAMLVLRQNRMVVVGRMEGTMQEDNLVHWVQDTVSDFEAFIVAAS